MRDNLETFPTKDVTDPYPRQAIKDFNDWKRRFEKELRDAIKLTGDFTCTRARGRTDLRKEILGE